MFGLAIIRFLKNYGFVRSYTPDLILPVSTVPYLQNLVIRRITEFLRNFVCRNINSVKSEFRQNFFYRKTDTNTYIKIKLLRPEAVK